MPVGSRRVIAALLAALFLGACTSDEPGDVAQEPSPSPKPKRATCPLTGQRPRGRIDPTRPAIAVKIENSPQARPQAGLERADVVFEEVVEGGITRFLAIYHCSDIRRAGPIRSARFDDPKLVKPFTRVLAYSGANAIVEKELKKRGLIRLHEDNSRALFRVPRGILGEHNLFVDVAKVRREVRKRKLKPPAKGFLRFGEVSRRSRRARAVTLMFGRSGRIEYRWKRGAWRRFEAGRPFRSSSRKQIAADNVIVLEVLVNNARGLVDVAGNASPSIRLIGRGRAVVLRDGRAIPGTWKIKRRGRPPSLVDRKGKPIALKQGRTWVELVPSRKGEVKGSFAVR